MRFFPHASIAYCIIGGRRPACISPPSLASHSWPLATSLPLSRPLPKNGIDFSGQHRFVRLVEEARLPESFALNSKAPEGRTVGVRSHPHPPSHPTLPPTRDLAQTACWRQRHSSELTGTTRLFLRMCASDAASRSSAGRIYSVCAAALAESPPSQTAASARVKADEF